MKLTSTLVLVCLFGWFFKAVSQPWMRPPYYGNTNPDSAHPILLADVQKAFASWEQDHPTTEAEDTTAPRGDEEEARNAGWMQFKRWEYLMKPRVYPSGDVSLPGRNYHIYAKYLHDLQTRAGGRVDGSSVPASWTSAGPNSVPYGGGAGRINYVRINPIATYSMWVGSPTGGLWYTYDGGETWNTNTDTLSLIGSSDLVINPVDTSIMYLATGDGDGQQNQSIGILKSIDGGRSWHPTGLQWDVSLQRRIYKMQINPFDTGMLVAATTAGVFRTINSGITWTRTEAGLFTDITFKPGDSSTVYATSGGFYLSTDAGASFTKITSGLPTANLGRFEIGVSPANPDYVYLLACDSVHTALLGIYLSTDGGHNFTVQSTYPNLLGYNDDGSDVNNGQGWYDLSIAVDPNDANQLYVGGINHWYSDDAGVDWTCITDWEGNGLPYVHADIHNIVFIPGLSSDVFSGNDGGIFSTGDGGSTWFDFSANLTIGEMYALGNCATDSTQCITGLQDNGTDYLGQGQWNYVIGGDGMDCIIDYNNNGTLYGSIYYGAIYQSLDGGATFNPFVNYGGFGVNSNGSWVTPYVMNPTNDNILLVGKDQVYQTTDAGATWSTIGNLVIRNQSQLVALTYAPSNTNYIYAATDSQMFVCTNGSTFTEITRGLPVDSSAITSITVSNTNPEKVWVTFSGYSSTNKVFASSDAGRTWTNYSTGLPNLSIDCITYQNNTNDGLYAGADVGVYFRSNSMSSWQLFSGGLPNVIVDQMSIQYQMNKIQAATYGRGLWQSSLAIPVPGFTVNRTYGCSGESFAFTDQSVGTPSGWSWTFTGGTPSTSAAKNPSVVYSAPGSYPVTLVVSNVYGTDSITQTGYITVSATPDVSLHFSPDTICINSAAFSLTGGSPAGGTYSGQGISGNVLTPSSLGAGKYVVNYRVTANGCTASDSNYLVATLCTGIQEQTLDNSLMVYPNPVENLLVAESPLFMEQKSSATVYDATGRQLSVSYEVNGNKIMLHADNLAAGTYWLKLNAGEFSTSRIFLKI